MKEILPHLVRPCVPAVPAASLTCIMSPWAYRKVMLQADKTEKVSVSLRVCHCYCCPWSGLSYPHVRSENLHQSHTYHTHTHIHTRISKRTKRTNAPRKIKSRSLKLYLHSFAHHQLHKNLCHWLDWTVFWKHIWLSIRGMKCSMSHG